MTHCKFHITETPNALSRAAGDEIAVMTWNIGYANLGATSDFFSDGGKAWRGASQTDVLENLEGIKSQLGMANCDVFLLQELARGNIETFGADTLSAVRGLSPGWFGFSASINPKWMPPPIRLVHGLGSMSRVSPLEAETIDLPSDGSRILGLIAQNYHAQVLRFASEGGGKSWTLINIHLAAFDEGANARREQLAAVFELAQAEAATGADVIIGGDWNLRLTDTNFPYTTLEEHLFWIHDFPMEMLPEGWQIVIDPTTPTVRTLERSYSRGENYTTIIDGFIVSPGVEVLEVSTTDLDFQPGDHQPVRARFRHSAAPHD